MKYEIAVHSFDSTGAAERNVRQVEVERSRLSWAHSPDMQAVDWMIDKVADNDVTVLIRGESGVGKELVARAIHQRSPRWERPYVKVNCAALPAELLESELFGHEKGAFTGAIATRLGKFEVADNGTLFLDEVGELTAALQAKLLHVVQDSQFTKLGSNRPVSVNTRLIAATNRPLEEMMVRREFREDLFYRLKVIEITVPPLRNRRAEIPHLCRSFVQRYARQYNRPARELSPAVMAIFMEHDWPGNIRELENMIKRIVILQDEQIVLRDLNQRPPAPSVAAAPTLAFPPRIDDGPAPEAELEETTLDTDDREEAVALPQPEVPPLTRLADIGRAAALEAERRAIEQALERTRWNRKRAAEQLDVSYKTLLNRIKECGINRD
jgi:two-component system, NtrC family, response regulator AtoC